MLAVPKFTVKMIFMKDLYVKNNLNFELFSLNSSFFLTGLIKNVEIGKPPV